MVVSYIFVQSDSLCLLIGIFGPFTFNVIIDMVGFKSIILSVLCFIFALFFFFFTSFGFHLFSYNSLLCYCNCSLEVIVYIFNLSYSTFK